MAPISACLLTKGDREEELDRVITYLDALNLFDEILIKRDAGERLYGRYVCVDEARNDIVYVQDDDCIVTNVRDIIEAYKKGVVVCGMTAERWPFYENSKTKLVGWGAVFDKNLVDFSKYLDKFPNDDLFKIEADRVFTYLNKCEMVKTDVMHFPCAYSSTALSLRKNHDQYHEEIKRRLEQL